MKTKTLAIVLIASLAFAGCAKENVTDNKGIPMTLNVSIENATRTTYTPDGNALKVEWEPGDKISVLSFDASTAAGKALTNDIFTTETGGTTASFSGNYTGAENSPLIRVVYPALTTTGTILGTTGWASEPGNGMYKEPIFVVSNTTDYQRFSFPYYSQLSDNDPAHLKYYDYMYGTVSSINEVEDVKLVKNTAVIKAVINTSAIETGEVMKTVGIKLNGTISKIFNDQDWAHSSTRLYSAGNYGTNYIYLSLGNNSSGNGGSAYFDGITKTEGDNELVAFIPIMRISNTNDYILFPSGYDLTLSIGCGKDGVKMYSKTVTLTNDIQIEIGTCFTLTATVAAE